MCVNRGMDVRGKFGKHEIPLTNRVRGPLYMLRTEFFFARVYGPSTKRAGTINRAEKTWLVLTVSTYVLNQQNFWGISIFHGKEMWDGWNPYRVVNDSATYYRIFGGLGIKFTKWLFPKGLFMYQTSSPGFCWCLLQRKTVYFENSVNTLTQFGRFMLLTNHHNVCKTRVFHAPQSNITKGRNWSIETCRICIT